MRFQKTIDIWTLSEEQRAALQPGQWVIAGNGGSKGRFYGQGASTVVAWTGNARGRYRSYMATIRDYGKTVSTARKTRENLTREI